MHPDGQRLPEAKYAWRRDCWGQGLASELLPALLAYGARQHGMRWVIATVAAPHLASQRVLVKAGMRFQSVRLEADGRNPGTPDGQPFDVLFHRPGIPVAWGGDDALQRLNRTLMVRVGKSH